MTNREKYKEIFGEEPDLTACPTNDCKKCPRRIGDDDCKDFYTTETWWDEEYKNNG